MATQGMVSVVSKGSVVMKIITGSDGFNASKLADWLRTHPDANADEVYEYSLSINFGSRLSLVVQTSPENYRTDIDCDELPDLYRLKFSDPKFNPRWKYGSVDQLVIVQR